MPFVDQEKFFVWDYAGTLVDPAGFTPKARPDIKEALDKLSDLGFHHLVFTGGERGRTLRDLKTLGLRGSFLGVLGREDMENSQVKSIVPVLKRVGLSPDEAVRRMIVAGDSMDDCPGHDILFILHKRGYQDPADAEVAIVEKLLELERDDLSKGFDALYDSLGRGKGKKALSLGRHRFTLEKSRLGTSWRGKVYYEPKIVIP